MNDLRAGVGRLAAVENTLRAPGQRIGHAGIGERKFGAREKMIDRIGGGAAGLPETDVERHQSAADMGQRAFEDDRPVRRG